jgi:hypothetical protein
MVKKEDVSPAKTYNQKCAFPYCKGLALENVSKIALFNDARFCKHHAMQSKMDEIRRFHSFVEWERERRAAVEAGYLMPDISEYVPPPPAAPKRIPKPKPVVNPTWEILYRSRAPKGESVWMRKPIRVKAANEEAAKLAFVAKRSKVEIKHPSTVEDILSVTKIERKPRTVRPKQDILDPFREAGFRKKVQEFAYQQKKVARDTRDKSIGFDGRYTGPDSQGAGILKTEEGEE